MSATPAHALITQTLGPPMATLTALQAAHRIIALHDVACAVFTAVHRQVMQAADALHPLGPVVLPPRARVVERVRRIERDEVIWRAFTGTNYAALALKHRLTVRQIRRIVERMRRRGPGT